MFLLLSSGGYFCRDAQKPPRKGRWAKKDRRISVYFEPLCNFTVKLRKKATFCWSNNGKNCRLLREPFSLIRLTKTCKLFSTPLSKSLSFALNLDTLFLAKIDAKRRSAKNRVPRQGRCCIIWFNEPSTRLFLLEDGVT